MPSNRRDRGGSGKCRAESAIWVTPRRHDVAVVGALRSAGEHPVPGTSRYGPAGSARRRDRTRGNKNRNNIARAGWGNANGWIASPTLSPIRHLTRASSPGRRRGARRPIPTDGRPTSSGELHNLLNEEVRRWRARVSRPRSRTWPVGVGPPLFPLIFSPSWRARYSRAFSRCLTRFPPEFPVPTERDARRNLSPLSPPDASRCASQISLSRARSLPFAPSPSSAAFNTFSEKFRGSWNLGSRRSLTVIDVRLHRRYPQVLAEILHSCFVQLVRRHRSTHGPSACALCLAAAPGAYTPLKAPAGSGPSVCPPIRPIRRARPDATASGATVTADGGVSKRVPPECRRSRNAARPHRTAAGGGSPNCRRLPALTSRRPARIEWRG